MRICARHLAACNDREAASQDHCSDTRCLRVSPVQQWSAAADTMCPSNCLFDLLCAASVACAWARRHDGAGFAPDKQWLHYVRPQDWDLVAVCSALHPLESVRVCAAKPAGIRTGLSSQVHRCHDGGTRGPNREVVQEFDLSGWSIRDSRCGRFQIGAR